MYELKNERMEDGRMGEFLGFSIGWMNDYMNDGRKGRRTKNGLVVFTIVWAWFGIMTQLKKIREL